MKKLFKPNLYIALIHYPVFNKSGDVIASAVTNLDLHDLARASKTYGIKIFYAVTPLIEQKELINTLVSHWVTGFGGSYNPIRRDALELINIKESLEEVVKHIKKLDGNNPKIVATCAKDDKNRLSFASFRNMLKDTEILTSYLLIFGTAWGLTSDIIKKADYVLEPIIGNNNYNHLSVRSAASIILDRLIAKYS